MNYDFIINKDYLLTYKIGELDTECIDFNEKKQYYDYKTVKNYEINVYAKDKRDIYKSGVLIGKIQIYLIDLCSADISGYPNEVIFDNINQDVYDLYKLMLKDENLNNYLNSYEQILYMERLFVKPEYRKFGIGTEILKNLRAVLDYFLNVDVRCFLTIAYPIIMEQNERLVPSKLEKDNVLKEQLEKFYTNCGYRILQKSNKVDSGIYMSNDLDY